MKEARDLLQQASVSAGKFSIWSLRLRRGFSRETDAMRKAILKVLSLDTSTSRGSVALLTGEEVIADLRLHSKDQHSERLLGFIDFLLGNSGWTLAQLNLIAVGIGPGSFTGIRIAVSTALGLAQSLSCPLACVSGLDALAHEMGFLDGRIGIVMDAQRMQVYYAEYSAGNGQVRRVRRPALWFPQDLESVLGRKRVYVAGDGAVRYAGELRISATGRRRLVSMDLFLAAAIARLALARRSSWRSGDFLKAEPLYIRPPDALRNRRKRR
jgi:tRNA threonylcarbamoyladenosine biosynthesis protein TsaB